MPLLLEYHTVSCYNLKKTLLLSYLSTTFHVRLLRVTFGLMLVSFLCALGRVNGILIWDRKKMGRFPEVINW